MLSLLYALSPSHLSVSSRRGGHVGGDGAEGGGDGAEVEGRCLGATVGAVGNGAGCGMLWQDAKAGQQGNRARLAGPTAWYTVSCWAVEQLATAARGWLETNWDGWRRPGMKGDATGC